MPRTIRIGLQIDAADPFWVLVRDAVIDSAHEHTVDIYPIDIQYPHTLPVADHFSLIEELLAQEIDSVICLDWPVKLAQDTLDRGISIIHLTESDIRHPLFASPIGLYDIAKDIGLFIGQRLNGKGRVLVVGGQMYQLGEDGKSRIIGIKEILSSFPEIQVRHVPSLWTHQSACQQLRSASWSKDDYFDALFGLSDTLALAGRDTCRELNLIDAKTLIVGINGDPLALSAIMDGSMTATIQTSPTDIAAQAVDLACLAAKKQPLPAHYSYKPYLVTKRNVSKVAVKKLIAIADLPSQLIDNNYQESQARLSRLETSIRINQQAGSLLDRQQISKAITNLIRDSFNYDVVNLYLWNAATRQLILETLDESHNANQPASDESGLLAETIRRNQPLFIPDMLNSHRFRPDPAWPDTRSRVIVPIRLGESILGLLDLHSRTARQHARLDLVGLQSLADQLGIAMRNAELYSEAVQARSSAEKADLIKTRLLANVSHELRTPLNVILGFASAALAAPNPYEAILPSMLIHDLQNIYDSGEHLMRVINDLLDLSRAEINELDLIPEIINTRPFLEEVFRQMVEGLPARKDVVWQLEIPDRLPLIQADPVRLRQILFNLLNNAYKFINQGEIILGAEVHPPHLHLWVKDTGIGIPPDLQETIFEPFSNSKQARQRGDGVGLGLSITRRLVLLHGGSLTLDSQPGRGSTFHVFLPLPSLTGQRVAVPKDAQPVLLVITAFELIPTELLDLCTYRGWSIERLNTQANSFTLPQTVKPAAIAWDLAHASPGDWNLIQSIQAQPRLAGLPFILYGSDQPNSVSSGLGLTSVLMTPLNRQTLIDTISGLRPSISPGPILIVEDDPLELKLYTRLVNRSLPGYAVKSVANGQNAVETIEKDVPSLVILHLSLPDIDGFTLLQKIRSKPATQRVPVIIMSGQPLTFDDVRRLDHYRVTYLSKNLLTEEETAGAFHQAFISENPLPPQTSLAVKQAIAFLHQNYHRDLSRNELAAAVGVSQDYLSHIFRQELNLSPWDYLTRYRIQIAKRLLLGTHESITLIACKVGFADLSYFNRVFRKQVGCAPGHFREQVPAVETGLIEDHSNAQTHP